MKRIFTYILLSLFIAAGSVEAYADNHGGRGRDRQEQRSRDRKHNSKENKRKHDKSYRHDKKDKDHKHKNDKGHYGRPGNSRPAPGHGMGRPVNSHKHMAPPPPPRRHRHVPAPPPPPHRLGHMVRYATRGCHDVDVWQVNHDTYVVKYRRGNRYYTQYLYPYADRYGERSLITVNWQPLSPWTLIPPIQLNINI